MASAPTFPNQSSGQAEEPAQQQAGTSQPVTLTAPKQMQAMDAMPMPRQITDFASI